MSAGEAIRDAKWALYCWEVSPGFGHDPELTSYAKASVKLQIAILETLEGMRTKAASAPAQVSEVNPPPKNPGAP